MSKRDSGSEAFDAFYQSMYGDRWILLRQSLLSPAKMTALHEGLLKDYFLDESSAIAAHLLPMFQGGTYLDMCAAPGGKSLILASLLKGNGNLICNDRSSQRRARLRRVLDEHLPESWRTPIRISAHDATKWSLHEQSVYDGILLDAPCSSERHVIADQSALSIWTSSRTKHLAIQQFAMLAAALEAVKPGGFILYCTCALSTIENEGVIEKLYRKREGRFAECRIAPPWSEIRPHGAAILPDHASGRGPMYMCLIRRVS